MKPFLVILMAILTLPAEASGESEAGYQEPDPTCHSPLDPEVPSPIFGISDGGAHVDGVAFSHLSYIYPPNSSIYYQACNVKPNGDPVDLVWVGPNIAAGRGKPLHPGLCIDLYRTSNSVIMDDTTIYTKLNSTPVPVPAYIDCAQQSTEFEKSSSYIRSFLPTAQPLRLSYEVYEDTSTGEVMFRIFWWPSSLTVIAGFDNNMGIDISTLEGDVFVKTLDGLEEDDQDVIDYFDYAFDGVIVFMELASTLEGNDDDEQSGTWASVLVPTKTLTTKAKSMPMPILIKNQDMTAIVALIKSAAVKDG